MRRMIGDSGSGHGDVVQDELKKNGLIVVCYESIKREVKRRPIYECRSDERIETKTEESTRRLFVVYYESIKRELKKHIVLENPSMLKRCLL